MADPYVIEHAGPPPPQQQPGQQPQPDFNGLLPANLPSYVLPYETLAQMKVILERAYPAAEDRGRAPAPAAPAPVAGITHEQARNRIRALNGGTPGLFPAGPLPGGWNQGHVNGMIRRADDSVPAAIKNSIPFNQAPYDLAMLAWLNNDANQRWAAGPLAGTAHVVFNI